MEEHRLRIQDCPYGEERTLRISSSLVRFALERRHNMDSHSAETCLIGATAFTLPSQRECAFTVYTTYPSNTDDLKNVSHMLFQSGLAVPSLGNRTQVNPPILDHGTYENEMRRGSLYLPIVEMHTHPGKSAVPSSRDKEGNGDIPFLESRNSQILQLGNARFSITNPCIHIVAKQDSLGTAPFNSGFLWYQFTGNQEALEKFKKNYDALWNNAYGNVDFKSGVPASSIHDASFAQEMRKSGAFKTAYFPPQDFYPKIKRHENLFKRASDGDPIIDKKIIAKLSSLFAYDLKIRRI